MKFYTFILLLLIIPSISNSQEIPKEILKDTIYGNIKKIREKVVFLTKVENPQMLYYDDYGHSGFMGPAATTSRFYKTWFSSDFCYYINYERHFDEKRNVIKDFWYDKQNEFMYLYKYKYDNKNRVLTEIDSTDFSVRTKNSYYQDYGNITIENIISQSSDNNHFKHLIYFHKDNKLTRSKNIDDNGYIDEYIYNYNSLGKLSSRIHKDPMSYKKHGENSWSHGIQDSIGKVHKDLANVYDKKNRLINSLHYSFSKEDNYEKPKLIYQEIYTYKNDNLISFKRKSENGGTSIFFNYKYDKQNRLVEYNVCNDKNFNPRIIEKYKYKNNKIISLEYTDESYDDKFKVNGMKKSKSTFSYKYDAKNNWIEIIKNVDGVDLYKWTREIAYY
ncbi:hypothetical protein FLGE108171_00450 [Flavobacterium gelidilacus]|uniref:hypothetical protein n=1 Tax=Flavobacterium gelidilacus TaxID=206041 RepID=UPI0012FC781C|nr:hypothetical protein [Flavobacterium gelidilacus]